ncbi:MAG: hypothetical protein H3C31_11875 [Brumimicrobium sp.]|nr:hypothetical protein [Brumimicrobium sp.]MCO5267418.1 hypothetical protein [Brumimicrobium sp.]
MKKFNWIFISIVFSSFSWGQSVFPFSDNLQYFKSFHEGMSIQLDYLPPIDYKYSENIIAYIDNKSDLFVFDGKSKQKLSGFVNDYAIGRNIVAWNAGPILAVWDQGTKKSLTNFARKYVVTDSLVVFDDERDNAIRVYYNGGIYDLYYSIGRPVFPQYIGSNTVSFVGNGDINYVFIAGKIIEVGSMNANTKFSAGGNLLVFNDSFNQTFSVAFKSEVMDVEKMPAIDYKAGYDMFVYTDINYNLKGYIDGEIVELSSNASFYEVFRNMVVWGENGSFFTYKNGRRYEIANYIPEEFKLRDGIVAFRNLNRGISVFHNETVELVSNLIDAPFEVNGNTVQVRVTRGNYQYFKNGYRYED